MKKIAILLILVLCLGCAEPTIRINLKFRQGQTVNLKIGGRGQIIEVDKTWIGNHMPYRIRIQTDGGPKYMWFREFELEEIMKVQCPLCKNMFDDGVDPEGVLVPYIGLPQITCRKCRTNLRRELDDMTMLMRNRLRTQGRGKTATYVGNRTKLYLNRAIVFEAGENSPHGLVHKGYVVVQLYDMATGLGNGWHEFPATDWRVG